MKQRVSLRLSNYGGDEGIKDEFVVVVVAKGEGDNSPVIEVQDGAEIELVYYGPHIVFELSYICQPLSVGCVGVETAPQVVLCHILWRCRAPGTTMPSELDGGLDVEYTVDAQDSFIIDVDIMVPVQLIPYPAISHIRVGIMDFLHLFRDALVFLFT